jgi:atrial natriuretic peptide receptor A
VVAAGRYDYDVCCCSSDSAPRSFLPTVDDASAAVMCVDRTLLRCVVVAFIVVLVDGQRTVEDEPRVIKLGVILPASGSYPWSQQITMPAIEYALEDLRNRSDLLTNYELRVHTGDSRCSDTYGPLEAIDMYLKRKAHVFIGPACDYAVAPVARFSPHWNIPVLTGGALVKAFTSKTDNFSQLTRMMGSYEKVAEFLLQLFRAFKWDVYALVYNSKTGKGKSNCFFVMEAIFYTLKQATGREPWYKFFNEGDADESTEPQKDLTSILRETSLNARRKHRVPFVIS